MVFSQNKVLLSFFFASTSSPSIKIPDSINMQINFISEVQLLDTRCLLHHCRVHPQCLCTGGFECPHHTCVSWISDQDWLLNCFVMSQITLIGPRPLETDRQWAQRSFLLSANFCTCFILHSEAQISNCSNKKKNIFMSVVLCCPFQVTCGCNLFRRWFIWCYRFTEKDLHCFKHLSIWTVFVFYNEDYLVKSFSYFFFSWLFPLSSD